MSKPHLEIGPSQFAQSRRAERAQSTEGRRVAADAALAALHAARDLFAAQAAVSYVNGAAAAAEDSDGLEEIADRLAAALEGLQPVFHRLNIARDVAVHGGQIHSRRRSCFDPARLALLAAEVLAEDTLCGEAGAVLLAAVRHRTL